MDIWKPDICVYHGGCDDGFGAAWAIRARWPQVEFIPGSYGKAFDMKAVAGRNVLFVDFSLKRLQMIDLSSVANRIVVIDHHKTAQAELAEFLQFERSQDALAASIMHQRSNDYVPVHVWFDMEQSAATMAWQFAHDTHRAVTPCPQLLSLIEDRDLWRFAFGETTRQFSAALRSYDHNFYTWDSLATNVNRLVDEGKIILRAHMKNVREFARQACMETISGHVVPVANVPYHYASDVAHELLQMHPAAPFAASFYRRSDGRFSASLRSEDGRMDVSEVAKTYGGGGHRNAAGFEIGSLSEAQ